MVRNFIFGIVVFSFLFIACRGTSEEVQTIDQVLNIYIDSAGRDMLNSRVSHAYTQYSFNDVYASVDNAPVNLSAKKNADTIVYLEYIAGAKRKLIDSSDSNNKIYQSKIAFNLVKKKTPTTNSVVRDTMILNYKYSTKEFQIHTIYYNRNLVFTKSIGQPNIIKIHK